MELFPVRRPAGPDFDPAQVPSDPDLVERIRSEIERQGPMTFARFMALALTDPEHGYYATSAERPSRAGDFLTAPELHPIFGWTLARTVDEAWQALGRPSPFVLREYGAGSGALGAAIRVGLERDGSELVDALRYEPIDVSTGREAAARLRFAAARHSRESDEPLEHRLGAAAATSSTGDMPAGLVLANEYLDALPVHRLVGAVDDVREAYVALDADTFVEQLGPVSSPALLERLRSEGVRLEVGQRAEVCLAIDAWARDATRDVGRGLVLVIDYGAPASELYDVVVRGQGTLRAYVRQRVHADPFVHIGRQDITAHVDLTAVERALGDHGFGVLGRARQSAFLVGSGMAAVLEGIRSDTATTAQEWANVRSAVARLLDPRALGAFWVFAAARGLPADRPLAGFRPTTGPSGGG